MRRRPSGLTALAYVGLLCAAAAISGIWSPASRLALAQSGSQSSLSTAKGFVGQYAVSALPTCDGVTVPYGSIAYATDLGGGANIVRCVANAWQHVTLGIPTAVSQASGTVTLQALVTPPIIFLTGNVLVGTSLNLSISQTWLYPGYCATIVKEGILSGTIGISVNLVSGTIPILGNSRSTVCWDGTALKQIQ